MRGVIPISARPRGPSASTARTRITSLGAVDWKQYLETLARDGMNYTRVFVGSYVEGENDIPWMKYRNTLAPRPGKLLAPWARSDVAGYRRTRNDLE